MKPASIKHFLIMRLCGGVVVFFFLLWYVYDIFSTPRTKGALLLWTVILGVCLLFWIWLTVRRSLKPMKRLVTYVQKRDPSDFSLFSTQVFPRELALMSVALNEWLEQVHSMVSDYQRFAADAAHELKTPIAALKIQAQVALNTEDTVQRNMTLNNVIKAADRCAHVVQQLLTLSRLENDHQRLEMTPFDVTYVAKEMVAELAPQAIAKNIEIDFEATPQNIVLMGNEIMLSILLRNLIDNAIRYTPQGGEIHIKVEALATEVSIYVIDTGPGIPIEVRDKIFDRFYRLLGSEATGSGLGLAIVAQIVKIHHADISLDDAPGGAGLMVRVDFPNMPPEKL